MFKQISMTNFKSWRETGPVPLAPLTGFFGANSSGKSSLLQMLLLLKQTSESSDPNLVLQTGSLQKDHEGYVRLGTASDLTYGSQTEMTFGLVFDASLSLDSFTKLVHANNVDLSDLSFETTIYADRDSVYVSSLRYYQGDDFLARLSRQSNNHYRFHLTVKGEELLRPIGRPRENFKPVKMLWISARGLSRACGFMVPEFL